MKTLITTILLVCYLVFPARANSMKNFGNPDSLITAALARIEQDTMHSYVQSLQDMGTRFMIAPNRKEVAIWILNKFISFGITDVRLDSFPAYVHINIFALTYDTTTWQYNVEARIPGTEFPDQEMIMLAHYDDATQNVDPIFFAPGADDNASGTAAVLECARVIREMNYQPRQSMIFLVSAAEELMYYGDSGTEHYAAEAVASGKDIVMVLNNDMIGWNDGTNTIQLFNHIGSPEMTELALNIITNYTSLNYQSHTPVQDVGGDIQPFLDAGYHGIYFMEHSINPNYHTLGDSIDNLDFGYMAEATAINLGCILQTDFTTNVNDYLIDQAELEIIPNPATEYIIIRSQDPNIPQIVKIYGIDGTLKLSKTLVDPTTKIGISQLPTGIYLVVSASTNGIKQSRLVVL